MQIRDRKFSKTTRYMVPIRTDRPHSWKHHFRGVVAEVIGYLEMLAKRDPHKEYFVFATVENIVKHCNRYRKGKPYSLASVKLALEYLRGVRVISGIVERGRMNQAHEFQVFTGRIVTPHHVMCQAHVDGKYCLFRPNKFLHGHRPAIAVQTKNVGNAGGRAVVWYVPRAPKAPVKPKE